MSIWASLDLHDDHLQQRQARAVNRGDTDGNHIEDELPLLLDVAVGADDTVRLCVWEDEPFRPVVEMLLPLESAATLRDLLDKAVQLTERPTAEEDDRSEETTDAAFH